MLSDELARFIRAQVGSVWALDAMLRMMARPDQAWSVDLLVRELRASHQLVVSLLDGFERTGLAVKAEAGTWRWAPTTPELARLSENVAGAYRVTPFAVIQIIVEAPRDQLSQFADAFKLRKD